MYMRGKNSKPVGKVASIAILLIFVGSLFAMTQFSGSGPTGSAAIDVEGNEFRYEDGFYITRVERDGMTYETGFVTNPADVNKISINEYAPTLLEPLNKVYVTYNPNEIGQDYAMLAYSEIGNILLNLQGKEVVLAFTEDQTPPNPDVPLRTCKDASDSIGVIELRLGGSTEVGVEGNCVVVSGNDELAISEASSKLAMWLAGIEI